MHHPLQASGAWLRRARPVRGLAERLSAASSVPTPDWMSPPAWLVELVKPKKAAIPWTSAIRAAIALGTPLAVTDAVGQLPIGLFIAMGALSGSVGDRRGPYRVRCMQIGASGLFGALGFLIGESVYGRGWFTLLALAAVAAITAMAPVSGTIASSSSLQMLVFVIVASAKPFPPPFWEPPALFLAGGVWASLLTLAGLFRDAVSPERRAVAGAVDALANLADAIGTDRAEDARRNLTDKLNAAYDSMLSGRVRSGGRFPAFRAFMALLNALAPLVEATVSAMHAGVRLPDELAERLRDVSAAILARVRMPPLPAVPVVAGPHTGTADRPASQPRTPTISGDPFRGYRHPSVWNRMRTAADQVLSGPRTWLYACRLTLCISVAELIRHLVPGDRTYWIALTTAIVLKPDFGSVFARALQRGLGTVIGVAIGAGLLIVVPHGPGLIACIAALAAILPVAIIRNYGMFATFLTPLVVLLLDLLAPSGQQLLAARLIDSLIGCGVVVVFGYLLWPETFTSRIGPRFVDAADAVADFAGNALAAPTARRGTLRRAAYRKLSDLRTVSSRRWPNRRLSARGPRRGGRRSWRWSGSPMPSPAPANPSGPVSRRRIHRRWRPSSSGSAISAQPSPSTDARRPAGCRRARCWTTWPPNSPPRATY